MLVAFGLGTYRLDEFKSHAMPDLLFQDSMEVNGYKARVISDPQIKKKSKLIELELYEILTNAKWLNNKGFVNAYFPLEDSTAIKKGDLLFIEGQPDLVSPPANPGEFNYKNYLVYNRVYHQDYIRGEYAIIGHNPVPFLISISDGMRRYCIDVINEHIDDKDAKAVILALSLGVKDELENDLVQAFSATGSMHVLAVSGLHVGIIYLVLFQFFRRIGFQKKRYRWLLAILSVSILWFYALLTGLSPSVLRAVTMFSFVAIGRALFRKGNIYNTLAASAFALLWFNPYLIMSVGFQLSYLAVFGIVYIQPKLYGLWSPKYLLIDKIWEISCVSIAAQLATGPLSMLYFHQFPTYFLVSNLFIIPAAFVSLLSTLVLLAVSFIPFLSQAVGWLISGFVAVVNDLVFWVSRLPNSTISGIYLDILGTWLLYLTLGALILYLIHRHTNWLNLAFACSLFFAGFQINHFSNAADSMEISQLKVNNARVLDLRMGFESKLMSDSAFLADAEKQRFHLHQKRIMYGTNYDVTKDQLSVKSSTTELGEVFFVDGQSVLMIKELKPLNQKLHFDFIFLDGRKLKYESNALDSLSTDQLIIGNNLWRRTEEDLMQHFTARNKPFHSLRTDGYFSHLWRK